MSWVHWALVVAVVAALFGGSGKISNLMGDTAKGIRAFRNGLKDESDTRIASSAALRAEDEVRG